MRRALLLLIFTTTGCNQAHDGQVSGSSAALFQYVVSDLTMPHSQADSIEFGFDLDRDGQIDNRLGAVIGLLFQANVANVDELVDELIDSGSIVHLIEVQADSLDGNVRASASMFIGADYDDDAGDNFSGSETFNIASKSASPLSGQINQAILAVGPGSVELELGLPGGESGSIIELIGARMTMDIEQHMLAGHVGGAITKEDVDQIVIPFVHSALARKIEIDCPDGACADSGDLGHAFLEIFDRNEDGRVELGEVQGHPVVELMTKPDVDLLDESGEFAPGADGIADSLSLGLGVTCVGAAF